MAGVFDWMGNMAGGSAQSAMQSKFAGAQNIAGKPMDFLRQQRGNIFPWLYSNNPEKMKKQFEAYQAYRKAFQEQSLKEELIRRQLRGGK